MKKRADSIKLLHALRPPSTSVFFKEAIMLATRNEAVRIVEEGGWKTILDEEAASSVQEVTTSFLDQETVTHVGRDLSISFFFHFYIVRV